jgi:tRNA-2-methylthio-N6-dimethylallyladenosine synthase
MGEDVFRRLPKLDFAVGPRMFGMIPKIVTELGTCGERLFLGDDNAVPEGMDAHPVLRRSGTFAEVQSYVTVLLGCDNRCSYCIVPDVRGHEYSRPAREVIAEVKCLAERGVKEVCLLGQSVLRYGMRNDAWPGEEVAKTSAFTKLLRELNEINGLERIRFTSAHPAGCTEELVEVYRDCPKVCRHLHLPVQSGSDRILKEMGRRYTREEYLAAVRRLRELDPEFALTTDVIVGYPGETEEDFEATRSLMDEAGFDNAFVFKYSPRPGTRSAALEDDVPKAEKERRDQVLLADQELRGQERNDRLVGSVREVLVEGASKRNPDRWSGRDGGNRIVVWDRRGDERIGDLLKVEIIEAHPQTLIGKVSSPIMV